MTVRLTILALSITGLTLQELPKGSVEGERAKSVKRRKTKEALGDFNVLVGEWRGIGQPKRGSRRGTWSEKAQWIWDFSKPEHPALLMKSQTGKLVKNIWLRFEEKTQAYVVDLQLVEAPGSVRRLVLLPKKQSETKTSPSDQNSKEQEIRLPPRMTFREVVTDGADAYQVTLAVLKSKRTTLLVEKGKASFRRVAEIGYTRKGESLAGRGSSGPECVVTGGAGTIRVMHKGKTYYVCCSGCKQAFDDDPEGVLADYRQRLAEEKNASKSK
ncbi:MAG: TRASH domain-containing protein [Planctomycetaceae bacterium]